MRTLLAAAALLCSLAPLAAEDAKGHEYESEALGFKAWFPGKPAVTHHKEETKAGTIKLTQLVSSNADGSEAYSVGVYDFPHKKDEFNVKKGLAGAIEGALKQAKMDLVELKRIQFGKRKLPGRDVLMEDDNGIHGRSRFVFDADKMRMHMVVIVGPEALVTGKVGDKFIAAFELTAK